MKVLSMKVFRSTYSYTYNFRVKY